MDPWGTPAVVYSHFDSFPSSPFTAWFLFVRYDSNHLIDFSESPSFVNFCKRRLWGTVSNASEKSNNNSTVITCCPCRFGCRWSISVELFGCCALFQIHIGIYRANCSHRESLPADQILFSQAPRICMVVELLICDHLHFWVAGFCLLPL